MPLPSVWALLPWDSKEMKIWRCTHSTRLKLCSHRWIYNPFLWLKPGGGLHGSWYWQEQQIPCPTAGGWWDIPQPATQIFPELGNKCVRKDLPTLPPMSLQALPRTCVSTMQWPWPLQLSLGLSKEGAAAPAPPSSLPGTAPVAPLCYMTKITKDTCVTSLHYLHLKKSVTLDL